MNIFAFFHCFNKGIKRFICIYYIDTLGWFDSDEWKILLKYHKSLSFIFVKLPITGLRGYGLNKSSLLFSKKVEFRLCLMKEKSSLLNSEWDEIKQHFCCWGRRGQGVDGFVWEKITKSKCDHARNA